MNLKERIQQDLQEAMRQRDAARTSVLRQIKAAMRNAEIDQQRELDDAGLLAVLDKAAKQRRESIESYQQGGRQDLVAVEEAELRTIESYLPRQLGPDEVRAAVEQAVAELGAAGPADMGRVMKHLMEQLRGQADGKLVNSLVREALAARSG